MPAPGRSRHRPRTLDPALLWLLASADGPRGSPPWLRLEQRRGRLLLLTPDGEVVHHVPLRAWDPGTPHGGVP